MRTAGRNFMHQHRTSVDIVGHGGVLGAYRTKSVSPDKVRGGLPKHQRYPIEKKQNVPYPTQLASKSLQLGIERFCRCVGSARNDVIEYFVLVRFYGVPDRLYFSQCGFRNHVVPFVESCPGKVFCKTQTISSLLKTNPSKP